MDALETFLMDLITDLEDIKGDIDFALGTDSAPYNKLRTVIENVEEYRDSLP
jgi:hypothetical protein